MPTWSWPKPPPVKRAVRAAITAAAAAGRCPDPPRRLRPPPLRGRLKPHSSRRGRSNTHVGDICSFEAAFFAGGGSNACVSPYRASADAHLPGGGPSGRGQHAPARNRFKGVMGVQMDLRGEIRNPPWSLWPRRRRPRRSARSPPEAPPLIPHSHPTVSIPCYPLHLLNPRKKVSVFYADHP